MWENQVLGDQTTSAKRTNAELTPEELSIFEDSPEGLIIEDQGSKKIIKGGRLAKLVEVLTNSNSGMYS